MDPLFWALILIGLALLVVFIELFIPSAGLLGILASGLAVASVVMAFRASFETGAMFLMAVLVAMPAVIYGMLKIWPHTPVGRRILLGELTPEQVLPPSIHSLDLVGQIGVAKTKMLPSGIVMIDGEKYDAVSDGFPIDVDQPVIVTALRANRMYVQPYMAEVVDPRELPARDRDLLAQPFEDLGLDTLDGPQAKTSES
jgi:membrane-bound ClpP family serine protease